MRIVFKNTYVIIILTLWISCAPKLRSSIITPQPPLSENAFVLILGSNDPFMNDGIKIGTIKASDNGLSTNCSYKEVIDRLKVIARKNGANVMKITEHKPPGFNSTCNRVIAEIYRVPNYKNHEREIRWSSNRKLSWEDFKGEPKPTSNKMAAAESYCGFGFQTTYVHAFAKAQITVNTTFDCLKSWVRDSQKDREELLQHEQFHFNISEVYARKLRKLYAENLNYAGNVNDKAQAIFKEVYGVYLARQELYDEETQHGLHDGKQITWQQKINEELDELKAYAQ